MATLQQAIDALNAAATAYNGKIASIDAKVAQAQTDFNTLTPARWIEDVITINGDNNYLYPVWWSMPQGGSGETVMEIGRAYNENGGSVLGSAMGYKNGVHVYSMQLQVEGKANANSGDSNHMQIKRFYELYDVGCSHVAFRMIVDAATSVAPVCPDYSGLYLRGGGLTYHVKRNQNMTINYLDGSLGIGGVTQIHTGYNVTPIYMGVKNKLTGLYPNIQTPATITNPGLVAV